VVLPIEARRALDIKEGDELVAVVEDDGVRLMTRHAAISSLRDFLGTGERSALEDLLAARRAEAEREAGE
jgi:bifunctional DNA-binding transcriptional regulator/antitoxin component of YhaV-PrlF toxin-antitoxin module